MEIWCSRSSAESGSRMTLQAENVQVAGFEQARVWGTVRRMAGYATLCFDRLVLEDERSLLVHVACETNRIPRRR